MKLIYIAGPFRAADAWDVHCNVHRAERAARDVSGLYPFKIVLDRPGTDDNDRRMHPTQKPMDLMRALVSDFTNPGELVLDSHAGSGTTGAACIELGRDFIGFEKDPKHHAIATARLARCVVDIGAVQRQGLLALPKPKQLTPPRRDRRGQGT